MVEDDHDDITQHGPPHGITLWDHAEITAEIAEGERTVAQCLAKYRLSESQWNEATVFWMNRIAHDTRENGEHSKLALVYSDAFAAAQNALSPVSPMDAEAYAALVVDIQKAGSPAAPLAARGLRTADYLRLARHMALRLAADPAMARAFAEAYERLQPEVE